MINRLYEIVNHYNIKIDQIVECGSRDLLDAIKLHQKFDAKVLSIECNPETIPICRKNIIPGIILDERCINDYDGECYFYQINIRLTRTTHKDGNPGASSIFKAVDNYTPEKYVQNKIKVKCARLNTILKDHNIKKIDLLWMDLQGAELIALNNTDNYLKDIELIMTEVEFKPIYHGQALFDDINDKLKNDFNMIYGYLNAEWFTNVIYINKRWGIL